MKNIGHIILKIVLSLILLSPILGATGIFPAPTRELYNTDAAFAFIVMLTESGYINYMIAVVNLVALFALWTKREALGALLIAPITAIIIGFHAFLDGGLLTTGAMLANLLFVLNIYFLWKNRKVYTSLVRKN